MTILYTSTLAFALSATVSWAKSQVCSPDACLDGKSSSSLLAHESSGERHLTFGTYSNSESSSANFQVSEILNITQSSDSFQINPPSHPVGFPKTNYFGKEANWTDGNWNLEDWKSLYLPNGWYGVLQGGKVVWGGINDKGELPNDLTGLQLIRAASASCHPSCSSHGTCLPAYDGGEGKCACATGWAGEACDQCATGHWGPSCLAGPSNCTIWDDGLSGTGACIGTASSSASTCNCEHGTCTSSTECICSAGWTTNSTASSSSSRCNVCAEGFFQDSQGNCLACPLGCESWMDYHSLQRAQRPVPQMLDRVLLDNITMQIHHRVKVAHPLARHVPALLPQTVCHALRPESIYKVDACTTMRRQLYATHHYRLFKAYMSSITINSNVMPVHRDASTARYLASLTSRVMISCDAHHATKDGCFKMESAQKHAMMAGSYLRAAQKETVHVRNALQAASPARPPRQPARPARRRTPHRPARAPHRVPHPPLP
ncbi:hypothetical protein IAT40_005985 [Kwoniella sp. CBS 6097]